MPLTIFGSNRHSHGGGGGGHPEEHRDRHRRNLDGQLDLFSVMSGKCSKARWRTATRSAPWPEYSHKELLQQEKRGQRPVPVRSSAGCLPGKKSARIGSHTIKDLTGEDAHVTDGEKVRIVCAVVKNRMMTTKSNSMMAFTSVEDLTGTMEVIVFPKVLDAFRDSCTKMQSS